MSTKVTGLVRWFNPEKSSDFITPAGDGKDAFVRFSATQSSGFKTLSGNQKVRFGVEQGPKGPSAINVMAL